MVEYGDGECSCADREPIGVWRTLRVMSDTDAEEWARALRGDAEAFARVFDRHRDRVLRHSLRLVPQCTDADDVTAMVFFEAWRKRSSVRFVGDSLLPWLLVTATNTARNIDRGHRRYRALLEKLPVVTAREDPGIGDDSPVETALRELSTADQQIITLCVLEGYTEPEAAQILGVARGTVKSRLYRAKQRLASRVSATESLERTTA
jgi:RNA polymerase sigma factor (sigma-70 family)